MGIKEGDIRGNFDFSDEMLAVLGEMAGVYLFVYRPDNKTHFISPAFFEKFNLPGEDGSLHEQWPQVLFPADRAFVLSRLKRLPYSPEGRMETDCRVLDRHGERVWVKFCAHYIPGKNGVSPMFAGSISELDLESRADTITGLLNQRQFEADYEEGFPDSERGFLVLVGIDNFKIINEQRGMQVGNQVLKALASCLEKHASPTTRIYRLEGDRFATLLADKNEMAVGTYYSQIKRCFSSVCAEISGGLHCTVSSGAAGYPQDSQNFHELCQFAESALNSAKRNGKNHLVFFSRETYEELVHQAGMREALQNCVQNGFEGFSLHYQPQIAAESGEVAGAEALLRWQTTRFGRVPPDVFVPLLESTGLIGKVGRWVLDNAIAQCRRWRRFRPDFIMSVNLSYQQFETDDIPGVVHASLTHFKLPGNALTLELVENFQMRDFVRFNEISSYLNRMGVSMSIDDFGTGYSSLGYFKELDVHQIKIDRLFISQMRESTFNYELVHFLVKLAHDAGASVCVEGVETAEELKALMPLKPDYYQGFYFGRPTDSADFERRFLLGWRNNGKMLQDYHEAHQNEEPHLDLSQFSAGEDTFMELLDDLPEVVMISDKETDEILFLNSAGRTMLGVQDYKGMRCYELLCDLDTPCETCEKQQMGRDRFRTQTYKNVQMGGQYLVRQKLSPWRGKLALLSLFVEPDGEMAPDMDSERRIADGRTLNGFVRTLAREENEELALQLTLKSLGEYYGADRAFLFAFSPGTDIANCVHEWYRPEVPPAHDFWYGILYSVKRPAFFSQMQAGKPIVTGRGETFRQRYPQEYEDICRYENRWMLLAPIHWRGSLIGFVGVGNPEFQEANPEMLVSLSSFIAQSFALQQLRDELFRSRYVDAHTGLLNRSCYQKDLAELVSDFSGGPFGVACVVAENFRELNQRKGHTAGDLMLQKLAESMKAVFDDEDCRLYRTSVDEILVLCEGAGAMQLAQKCAQLEKNCAGQEDCHIRVGHAFAPLCANPSHLLQEAYAGLQSPL